jgi:hypothetical protein
MHTLICYLVTPEDRVSQPSMRRARRMTYIAATRRKSQSEAGGNCCSIKGSPDRTGRMNWLDTLRWGCCIVDGWLRGRLVTCATRRANRNWMDERRLIDLDQDMRQGGHPLESEEGDLD